MILYTTLNYKNKLKSEYLNENINNLAAETFTIPESYNYTILEVEDEYVARPDLISLDIYGDDMFADIICKLNGISNPFELNAGMKLILPSPENILDFTHEPATYDNEQSIINKPVAKLKNEKRKANEAIVGDSRFKIDAKKGIVIY